MGRLSAKQRAKLPKRDFVLPGRIRRGPRGGVDTPGAYPINDQAHTRAAIARAAAQWTHGTSAQARE